MGSEVTVTYIAYLIVVQWITYHCCTRLNVVVLPQKTLVLGHEWVMGLFEITVYSLYILG